MKPVLRPSKAHQWSNCAASPLFSMRCPEQPETEAAQEGTAAAWVAELTLQRQVNRCADLVGQTHENGWLITPDMASDCQDYCNMIFDRGGDVFAELRVRFSDDPLIEGTLDAACVMLHNGVIHVDDLKYGYRPVEVWDNEQLIIYAAALVLFDPRYKHWIETGELTHVQLGIYQPRAFHHAGHYRKMTMTIQELYQVALRLIERAKLTQVENPVATPGQWCEYCPASSSCEASAHSGYAAFEVVRSVHQRSMSMMELGKEKDFLDMAFELIKSRRNAIDTELETRIMSGEFSPLYELKRTFGKRKLTASLIDIVGLTGVSPFDEPKFCTPKELERRKVPKHIVNILSTQSSGGVKLTRVDTAENERMFSNGT